jgi:ABC-type uncharacterized transport system permease subunit
MTNWNKIARDNRARWSQEAQEKVQKEVLEKLVWYRYVHNDQQFNHFTWLERCGNAAAFAVVREHHKYLLAMELYDAVALVETSNRVDYLIEQYWKKVERLYGKFAALSSGW